MAYSSADFSWSLASSIEVRVGPSKLPLGWLTLDAVISERTLERFRPLAARASGLTLMRTAWRWPPAMLTMPTPLICDSFCAMRVSTRVCNCGSGKVRDITATVSTGVSAGLTLL